MSRAPFALGGLSNSKPRVFVVVTSSVCPVDTRFRILPKLGHGTSVQSKLPEIQGLTGARLPKRVIVRSKRLIVTIPNFDVRYVLLVPVCGIISACLVPCVVSVVGSIL